MYNHKNRYRCTIIRGKAQVDIENLVPIYAHIVSECDGFDSETFKSWFDSSLSKFLSSPTPKTLANHRTEIAGKLFGMYYFLDDKLVVAQRTLALLEDEDLPLFFKSIVAKFQFPNGMDKKNTLLNRIENSIKIRPFHYILELLRAAAEKNIRLSKREIAYYALDSLDVLQSKALPSEVIEQISIDRKASIERKVEYPGKQSSYCMQHISEQLNILELANLITQVNSAHEKIILLNNVEKAFIDSLLTRKYDSLDFDPYSYISSPEDDTSELYDAWNYYYCSEESYVSLPKSSLSTIVKIEEGDGGVGVEPETSSPLDIGDEGEQIVFNYEKERVGKFNKRLAQQRVLLLGKQRGLGYDIQTAWADLKDQYGKEPDGVFYIEVKSTKRITPPSEEHSDKLVLTRNEWLSADSNKESFAIYRVYLTRSGVYVYKIFNPLSSGAFCTPIKYNFEFEINGEIEKWK